MAVIALDPGFGNTKACVGGKTSVIQTAVSRPKDVGLAAIGMKSAGRAVPIVSFDSHTFAVGTGAWYKGDPLTSMDYSALTGPERRSVFYGALAPLLSGDMRGATLVVGLPVPLLADAVQARASIEALKQFKGEHAFSVNGVSCRFSVDKIKVLAQPVGAYVNWLYDDMLKPRAGGGKMEAAIIDVGLNTLDMYVIQNGQVLESFIGGAEVGVKRLLNMLTGNGHDLVELDAQLRSGALRPEPAQLDAWLGEVLAAIKRTFPDLRRFDMVIPTGGGVAVLGERLKSALATKGAALSWPDDPVTANVRGLYKYGLKYA